MYDKNNIFAKILHGEIPCKKIYEDDLVLAFYDISPKARIHALVVPKIEVSNFQEFALFEEKLGQFFSKVNYIAVEILKLNENFRIQINNGKASGQEVFHFHAHILSN